MTKYYENFFQECIQSVLKFLHFLLRVDSLKYSKLKILIQNRQDYNSFY